ncbi:MAG: glycoside hydrolase family 30 beta sandwich domain-containing protein [Candidatus Syntrophosphaera sp.]
MFGRSLARQLFPILLLVLLLAGLWGYEFQTDQGIDSTTEILLTSAAGDKLALQENVIFTRGARGGTVVRIYPEILKQTIDGIGTSFTESSAFVLAHLEKEKRRDVMGRIFGMQGANFSLTRTHMGACDFSVKGKYSYADVPGDTTLDSFSIAPDKQGFDPAEFPGIKDETFDLLPMIKEALEIKGRQSDSGLRIISSAWTAPAWMKDIETWYIPGSPENNWQGTGGSLKEKYVPVYADYILAYLDAYRAEGVDIWGLTPVNEPHGNNGQWESMNFSPESQNDFIKNHLGPRLKTSAHADINLLIYDQNRDGLEHWTDVIFADPETVPYLYGAAVHWYESTFKVYEDVFDRVHDKFPDLTILHTEGCIDDLGKDPPGGVTDPEGFKESNWFDNDEFWWNKTATDWAYSVTWEGVVVDDHPMYTPVHRYARNIIVSLDHWLTGWIDWNIVLDRYGGPNHVGNFCGAPIMIDTASQHVYYTPIYYVLAQFSRTIRPGDQAVQTELVRDGLGKDDLHACATLNEDGILSVQLLNTTETPIAYNLQIGLDHAALRIAANSVQTVRVQLPKDLR